MDAIDIIEERRWSCGPEFASAFDSCSNYMGPRHEDKLVIMSRTRDAALLTQVNWEVAEEIMGEDAEIIRIGHWAVGWIEHLVIPDDAPDEVKIKAGEIVSALSDYPILDEERYSEAEWEAMHEAYGETVEQRLRFIQEYNEYGAGRYFADRPVSIFAARYDSIPEDEAFYDYLRTWVNE